MADDTIDINVDFPTFGNPTSPTSASIFNSNSRFFSAPFLPCSAKFGTCLVGVAKCEFPLPPFPPLAIKNFCPSSDKSATTTPLSISFTIVPFGTEIYKSWPDFPIFLAPSPLLPSSALNFFLYLKSNNVLVFESTIR